jgi:hypothetical protein
MPPTYLDMAVRARPASETPQLAVEELGKRTSHPLPGTGDERSNRLAEYLAICTASPHEHLDRDESELLAFLRVLLERQFDHCGIGR